jgi:hypothetical protein
LNKRKAACYQNYHRREKNSRKNNVTHNKFRSCKNKNSAKCKSANKPSSDWKSSKTKASTCQNQRKSSTKITYRKWRSRKPTLMISGNA